MENPPMTNIAQWDDEEDGSLVAAFIIFYNKHPNAGYVSFWKGVGVHYHSITGNTKERTWEKLANRFDYIKGRMREHCIICQLIGSPFQDEHTSEEDVSIIFSFSILIQSWCICTLKFCF